MTTNFLINGVDIGDSKYISFSELGFSADASGNGMLFGSMAEDVEWVRDNVKPTAGRGRIIMACKGKTDMAYGLEWKYESSTEGVGR